MINIKYLKINNSILKFSVNGHANYAEEGNDIVCSAVSLCVIGGLNALKNVNKYLVKIEKGLVEFDANNYINSHDQIVLETILVQLTNISYKYSKYVKIEKMKKDGKSYEI